jgi:hypothetical protein
LDTPFIKKLKRSAGVLEANVADNKAIAKAKAPVPICLNLRDCLCLGSGFVQPLSEAAGVTIVRTNA